MFARICRANHLTRMLAGETADRNSVNLGISQHLIQVIIDGDAPAVFEAQLSWIELSGGTHCRDLPEPGRVDRRYVRPGDPTVSDNTNVIFLHGTSAKWTVLI